MSIDFPLPGAGGGGFVFPVITDGIVAPSFFGFGDVSPTFYSALGWAFPLRITEDMNVDAFVYVTGSTVWSGRKIGIYAIDLTGFALGAELVAVSGLAPAATSEIITTFTPIALTKDQVVWIAAGGGTGTMKGAELIGSGAEGFPSILANMVGSIGLDLSASTGTSFAPAVSLQVSANTPAASGALIDASSANGVAMPICGLRKSA